MYQSSWWSAYYFRHTTEGLVFTRPPLWVFGRGREYYVSDTQAGQLSARIGRLHVIFFTAIIVLLVGALVVPAIWASAFVSHPIIIASVGTLIVLGAFLAMVYRAIDSVLDGVSWTYAPRDPLYGFRTGFKSSMSFLMRLPTWALVVLIILNVITLPISAAEAYRAIAAGQAGMTLVVLFACLLIGVSGAALVMKREAQRSAK